MNYQCGTCQDVCCKKPDNQVPLDYGAEQILLESDSPHVKGLSVDGTAIQIPILKTTAEGCVNLGSSGCGLDDDKPLYCPMWPFELIPYHHDRGQLGLYLVLLQCHGGFKPEFGSNKKEMKVIFDALERVLREEGTLLQRIEQIYRAMPEDVLVRRIMQFSIQKMMGLTYHLRAITPQSTNPAYSNI